jgi:aspartate/methionine/tyrosine aminotransferase
LPPEEITTRSGEMPTPASSIAGSMPVWRIREVTELAWEDPDAIHLEVGEPDLPTSEHVVDAFHRAAIRTVGRPDAVSPSKV